MGPRTTVLVVEDEPLLAADVSAKLERLGYHVPAVASHADGAFCAASSLGPDLVLMDINLAGAADGIEAAARIYSCLDIPVVFLTGHEDLETLQRAQAADPFGYLTKPAKSVDLANSLQVALTRYRKQSSHRLRELWLEAQLESASDGVVAADHEGKIRFINSEAERLLGVSSLNLTGRPFTDIPLRQRHTQKPAPDLVRLAFLHGVTMTLGDQYMVNSPVERKISGEVALSRVGGESIGIVFTFRDSTVQMHSRHSISEDVVKWEDSDCTRIPIRLNQFIPEMEPVILAHLTPGKQLNIRPVEPVRPIPGNRGLIETILLGLVRKAEEHLGPRQGNICISATDLDFKQHHTDGRTARYVRLRIGYRAVSGSCGDSTTLTPELLRHHGLSIDLAMAKVQNAIDKLRATVQLGSSDGWSYWDIDLPALEPAPAGEKRPDSALVILVEPDAAVRNVLSGFLSNDTCECYVARDISELLDWAHSLPGQIDVVILPEAYFPGIEILLKESPSTSVLLVRDGEIADGEIAASELLKGLVAPSDVIHRLFSRTLLREKLNKLCVARKKARCRQISPQLSGC